MAGDAVGGRVNQGRVVLILALPAKPSVFGEPRYEAGAGPFKVGPGAVIGEYEEMVAAKAVEVQRHRDLFAWCRDHGLDVPPHLSPPA